MRKPIRTFFCSYATAEFAQSKQRIAREAGQIGFAHRAIYGPEHLPADFVRATQPYINARYGAGYWLWKPLVLKATFDLMQSGDICVYADAGCRLNPGNRGRMYEYFDMARAHESGTLSFAMISHPERCWTNERVFEHFSIDPASPLRDSPQYVGGVLIMRKCKASDALVNDFLSLAVTRPDLFSDRHNAYKQSPEFIAHRHDQSIFSLLRKRYGTFALANETWSQDPIEMATYPIQAARLRT